LVTLAVADESPRVAIGELLAEHRAVLLAAARLITLNEAEAQDVVQITFEIALRRGHTLRDPGSLRAWLLVIETREAVRRARVMRRFLSWVQTVVEVVVPATPEDDLVALRDGMRALPRRVRAAIVLHYLEGYSVRETAAALSVSENTIKTQLKKGLARLREELRDE
jgi:RNA polymerase sigma-70 factor, ECF subfamily